MAQGLQGWLNQPMHPRSFRIFLSSCSPLALPPTQDTMDTRLSVYGGGSGHVFWEKLFYRGCVLGKLLWIKNWYARFFCGNMYTCIFIFMYLHIYIRIYIYLWSSLHIHSIQYTYITNCFWEVKAWGRFKCLKSWNGWIWKLSKVVFLPGECL